MSRVWRVTKLLANREPKPEPVKPMSYILDALKRADSERERGVVPGLHAQPVPLHSSGPAASRAFKPLVLLAGLSLLLAMCLILWRWLGTENASGPPAAVTPPMVNLPGPSANNAAPPSVPAASLAPARPVAAIPAPSLSPAPALPSAPPAVLQAPRTVMAPAQITPAAPTLAAPPSVAPPAAPPIVAAAAPSARVSALADLPADVRLAMPKIVISGSTYADNPAYRMLIINGQVFHEGEKLATDLQLEQIGPKSAVLNYRGQRYSVGY